MNNALFRVIDNTLKISKKSSGISEEDYYNPDGLLMCGKCHTPKEKFLDIDRKSNFYERYKSHPFPIVCKCRKEQEEAERQRQKQIETKMLIEKFRKEGITDSNYL